MPDNSPFADLPPALVAMLRDEANLSVAINVLEDSRRDNLTRTEEINARRPKISFLASKKDREAHQSALHNAQQQLAAIDVLLTRATTTRERLQPIIRVALVQHLGVIDPSHRQGLRAARFHEHWHRGQAIIADRLKGFLRDLREARAALAEDAKNARARPSSNSAWRLTTARASAAELERSISDLNAAATDHSTAVTGTPFAEVHLPMLELWPCISRIDILTARTPAEAEAEAGRTLKEFTEFREPALTTLEGMFKAAAGDHTEIAETRLRRRWSELLTHAEAHLVTDAELEPTLADIERRLLETERARLNSQFERQPFLHER